MRRSPPLPIARIHRLIFGGTLSPGGSSLPLVTLGLAQLMHGIARLTALLSGHRHPMHFPSARTTDATVLPPFTAATRRFRLVLPCHAGVLPQGRDQCGDRFPDTPPQQKGAEQDDAPRHDRVERLAAAALQPFGPRHTLMAKVIGGPGS